MQAAASLCSAPAPIAAPDAMRRFVARMLPHWTLEEVVFDQVPLGALEVRRAAVAARCGSEMCVTGSAAGLGDRVAHRAVWELVERACLVEAIGRSASAFALRGVDGRDAGSIQAEVLWPQAAPGSPWQYSKSNGVAVHDDWPSACRAASRELTERDAFLRAWFWGTAGAAVDVEPTVLTELPSYEWFGRELRSDLQPGTRVVAVFGIPTLAGAPLARGLGAAGTTRAALAKAVGECLQNAAFISPEDVPLEEPAPAPVPMYHLDRFLWAGAHADLRSWLEGRAPRSERRVDPSLAASATAVPTTRFADLTPPRLRGVASVAKAVDARFVPLTFGLGAPWLESPMRAADAHPIS